LAGNFSPQEDTWYFPRVAGTFKERSGFHGCQMPEQLLGRIVRICSRPRDIVLDPFSGSATTLAVAKKLGRRYVGFDLSPQYVERGTARLADTFVGDPLDGAPEPTMSAPTTVKSRRESRALGKSPMEEILDASAEAREERSREAFDEGLIEAFRRVYQGLSLDRVVVDPELSATLADECTRLGLPGDLGWWNRGLFRARKAGRLAHLPTTRRTEFSWEHCDPFLFAAEIAWRLLLDQGHQSLDEILCDPRAAGEFDRLASQFAPGFAPLEYRWAALKLRKQSKVSRSRAALIQKFGVHFGEPVEATPRALARVKEDSGLFLIQGKNKGAGDGRIGAGSRKRRQYSPTPNPQSRLPDGRNRTPDARNSVPGTQYSVPALYLGTALNLHARLEQTMTRVSGKAWGEWSESPTIRHVAIPGDVPLLLAYQSLATARHSPRLNLPVTARA
jgi:site-specific DNA-methyltransferase (adenine-specific)